MRRLSCADALCAAAALLALGLWSCSAIEDDLGDAALEITPEGGTETMLTHQPGRSEVRVTPPTQGSFVASFVYLDPAAAFDITIEDPAVAEQQDLSFPLDPAQAGLEVRFEEQRFTAAAGAEGSLTIERLDMVDDSSVSFRAVFQGTLIASDGAKAVVNGFIDAVY